MAASPTAAHDRPALIRPRAAKECWLCFECLSPIFRLSPASEGDDLRTPLGKAGPQDGRDLVAIHLRHSDVEQDHRLILRREGVERGTAIVHDVDLGTERFEERAESRGRVFVVVDDEDAYGPQ